MKNKTIWGAVGQIQVIANGTVCNNATSVTLPDVELPTAEIGGAGIMGKWNMPILGHVSPMSASIAVRAAGTAKRALAAPSVDLEIILGSSCRGSNGILYTAGTKFFLFGYLTKMTGGKGEPGSPREEAFDYAIVRFREVVEGVETVLVDQIANVLKLGGVDYMADIRRIFG